MVTSTGARIGERTNLEFFLLLTFNIGTTTNQYDEELARMLGKKVIFAQALIDCQALSSLIQVCCNDLML